MTAEELFRSGHLLAPLEQLNHEVRSRPADIQRRTFLFELLRFVGDYQRAELQLEVLGQQSATAEIGVQVYHHILTAEQTVTSSSQRARSRPSSSSASICGPYILKQCIGSVTISRQRLWHSWTNASAFQAPLRGSLEGQAFHCVGAMATMCWRRFLESLSTTVCLAAIEQIKRLHITTPKRCAICSGSLRFSKRTLAQWGRCCLPVLYLIRTGMLMSESS